MDTDTSSPPVTTDMFAVVMRELTDTVGDPATTLQTLHDQLTVMWNDAGNVNDVDKQNAISQVYDGFMLLQQQAGTALNIAAAARTLATTYQTQRDIAIDTAGKQMARATNDVDFYRRKGQLVAHNTLVATIAEACAVPEEEVALVLAAMRDDQFIDGYSLRQMKDAIKRAANLLNSL